MAYTAKKRRNDRMRRHYRIRKTMRGSAQRPRLAVFRSNKHISAQVIDDAAGITLASASSLELRAADGDKSAKAKEVGKLRVEGKDYEGADGDVLDFRFNV